MHKLKLQQQNILEVVYKRYTRIWLVPAGTAPFVTEMPEKKTNGVRQND